jgi:hypothetical protein
MNWQAASLVFAAGVFYAGVRLLRRDLNGVRRLMNARMKRQRERHTKLLHVLREALPVQFREEIIQMLPEDDE